MPMPSRTSLMMLLFRFSSTCLKSLKVTNKMETLRG
jgi:hypothetical protein